MDAEGDFVVTWTSNGQDGGNCGVYAQRYNAAGARREVKFRANLTTARTSAFIRRFDGRRRRLRRHLDR